MNLALAICDWVASHAVALMILIVAIAWGVAMYDPFWRDRD